jgi:transposase
MRTPDEVATMVRLHALGWGVRRIGQELGCSHMTVRRYLEAGAWAGYRSPRRAKALDGLEPWLAERLRRHRGNADVVRQELEREHGLRVSLRTVERAVQELRRELVAEARATVRFETPPGRQLQIDLGSTFATIADEPVRVHLFVAVDRGAIDRLVAAQPSGAPGAGCCAGGSACGRFVAAFRHERQGARLDGLERAFRHFGGVPEAVLLDNAKPLVTHHAPRTREVAFNDRFHALARYWGFRPQACAPYRARTKGPVGFADIPPGDRPKADGRARRRLRQAQRHRQQSCRSGPGGNRAAARRPGRGRPPLRLPSGAAVAAPVPAGADRRRCRRWAELEAHLARWLREVADPRIHRPRSGRSVPAGTPAMRPARGTTGDETGMEPRFMRSSASATPRRRR